MSTLAHKGVSLARLDEEIARCEVVCTNCHRRRTAGLGGWQRALFHCDAASAARPRVARNVAHVVGVLSHAGCVDCGERDVVVLDFDHVRGKAANVGDLVRNEVSIARIDAEIARCEVRCANCHRRRTAERAAARGRTIPVHALGADRR